MTDPPPNDSLPQDSLPQDSHPPAPPAPPRRPGSAPSPVPEPPAEATPTREPGPKAGSLGRLRTKAESAARQAATSPHVQSAASKTKAVAKQAAASPRGQAIADKTKTVAKQAAESPRGQAVVDKTKAVAKQAAESPRGQAVSHQMRATTERVTQPATAPGLDAATSHTPTLHTPKAPLPKTPLVTVGLTLLASIVAVVVTFFPWVTLDASQSADLAPDFVPDQLVGVSSSYRASAHTILGIGTLLAFIVVAAAGTVVLGLRGRGRWPFGLASAMYVIAAFIAAITIIALRIAESGYRWVLPDDWVGDSPTVTLSAAGLAFVIAAIVAALFSASVAFTRKP